jgi:hypothetical protein
MRLRECIQSRTEMCKTRLDTKIHPHWQKLRVAHKPVCVKFLAVLLSTDVDLLIPCRSPALRRPLLYHHAYPNLPMCYGNDISAVQRVRHALSSTEFHCDEGDRPQNYDMAGSVICSPSTRFRHWCPSPSSRRSSRASPRTTQLFTWPCPSSAYCSCTFSPTPCVSGSASTSTSADYRTWHN